MDTNLSFLMNSVYRIESKIGSGGSGVIYKAWHTRLKKYVVIKELKQDGFSEQDIEKQKNETNALKGVKSKYLPQVFDFLTEGNRAFTVMEFVEGESLDKFLERGQKFLQSQVIKWYQQLASALQEIHKKNICHRDIKPANIMLQPDGNICLIDFNAALVSGDDIQMISRSLGYASPEQYEIFEHFKNRFHSVSSGYSGSGDSSESIETEYLNNEDETERLDKDDKITEHLEDTQKTEKIEKSVSDGIDWKRSDIYSLGATMYHLLSGIRPAVKASQTKSLDDVGNFSEGIVGIIHASMQLLPKDRFADGKELLAAIGDIYKLDRRWKILRSKMIASAIILPLSFGAFAITAVYGHYKMGQEKEEQYYTSIYRIERDDSPQEAYEEALRIFENRIDPYVAMTERFWADGNINECREYIEENLGNIAEFQEDPISSQSFGKIYYILGNCYYYQSEETGYEIACKNFETAVQFVKDNPIYYRDYAVTLARIGDVKEAEHILEKAQVWNLDEGSLYLLKGEIAFAQKEYQDALQDFENAISQTEEEFIRYRACHTSDEIYKLLGQPEDSIKLLENMMDKIPVSCVPELKERLSDAYVKCNHYEKAVALLQELVEESIPQFHVMENLAILYENIGKFSKAADVLEKMRDAFPKDYRVPMHQAYLEVDRQSEIINENRKYSLASQYYDSALALYEKNVQMEEKDPEMQRLEQIFDELRKNQWIQ